MPTRYVPTGQPRHKQAPGPKPETLELIARVRAALADGVRRFELAEHLDETPGRIHMAMDYIRRWDGGYSGRPGRLPRPAGWGWQERAACRGEDLALFFGFEGERGPAKDRRERKAKAVCAGCPVRDDCLLYAIGRPEKYGIWSGMNEDERAAERRRRQNRQSLEERRAAS